MGLSWGWVVQGERRMLEYVGELWRSKLGDAVGAQPVPAAGSATRRERDTLACPARLSMGAGAGG